MQTRYTLRAEGVARPIVLDADVDADPRLVFRQLVTENGIAPAKARSFTREAPPERRTGFAGESGSAGVWEFFPAQELINTVRRLS